ncbi:unnamed protein product [Linum tenue]|uniref:BHLH domain-containing protein n=1 Tax=Linum tenue TaxID=586396 RepID=A0AAV0N312_9ROSI|nr:unnamed protein product [Linum tenue]
MENFGVSSNMNGNGGNHHHHHNNNFELLDFITDANFDQFVDLIRGRNDDDQAAGGGFDDCDDLIHSLLVDNPPHHDFPASTMLQPPPLDGGGHYYADEAAFVDLGAGFEDFAPPPLAPYDIMGTACFDVDINDVDYDDNDDYGNNAVDCGEEVSSGTTTTTAAGGEQKRRKGDRSKTLISERRRRGSMKEKLYALRSLVPNITKMDKASIIGDAVSYMQDLQLRSKKLQAEVAGLEASLAAAGSPKAAQFGSRPNQNIPRKPIGNGSRAMITAKKILMQMDVYQVEERGYYVRLVCNKGDKVAISLYKALESLASFVDIQTTNLATSASDKFILTFTLVDREMIIQQGQQIDLPNLKMWVTNALLNQGFEFLTL